MSPVGEQSLPEPLPSTVESADSAQNVGDHFQENRLPSFASVEFVELENAFDHEDMIKAQDPPMGVGLYCCPSMDTLLMARQGQYQRPEWGYNLTWDRHLEELFSDDDFMRSFAGSLGQGSDMSCHETGR